MTSRVLIVSIACLLLLVPWNRPQADPQPPVQFKDVTDQAGIRFAQVNGASGMKYYPELVGSGAAFFDYDNDGWLDLYFVNSGPLPGYKGSSNPRNVLYRNKGDGIFIDVTREAGVGDHGYGMGVAVGDYDNDGHEDLYITNFGPNLLYRNNGDGTFTDVSKKAGVDDKRWGASAVFFDADRDGDLDLFVANYVHYELGDDKDCGFVKKDLRMYCHPEFFPAIEDIFYENTGDGTFQDVTKKGGFVNLKGRGLGVAPGDYNNDDWPDLFVTNDSTRNFLYKNKRDGTFQEVAVMAGVAYNEAGDDEAGMGAAFGDVNQDGLLDIISTHLDDETNTLYINTGDGFFEDQTYARGLGSPSIRFVGFGTKFFDFDNDGDLDLFITNGHINDIIEMMKEGFEFHQKDQMFENVKGRFREISSKLGAHFQRKTVGRGAAFGDYDNDGDIDIVLNNNNQPAILLRNEGGNRKNWVGFKLRGGKSNRQGIGARLILEAGGSRQIREVYTTSSYLSQSDIRAHFGVGSVDLIDRVEIRWPSGLVQAFQQIPSNQYLFLNEGKPLHDRAGKSVGLPAAP